MIRVYKSRTLPPCSPYGPFKTFASKHCHTKHSCKTFSQFHNSSKQECGQYVAQDCAGGLSNGKEQAETGWKKNNTPAEVTHKIQRGTIINKTELHFKTARLNAFSRKDRLSTRASEKDKEKQKKKMTHAHNYDAINTSKNKHCRYQIKKKTEATMADTK